MMDPNDPALRSFIPVAPDSHFPIQNLPYGIFRPRAGGLPRAGIAIGDHVVDLAALAARNVFGGAASGAAGWFRQPVLNAFMSAGPDAWREVRGCVSRLLRADEPALRDDAAWRAATLHRREEVELLLPVQIGDYTDFYASRAHATNVGTMIRGAANALQANWLHLPVGYHGRASSVVVSGTPVRRPSGQTRPDEKAPPVFGPSRALDYELELGAIVGLGNALGEPVPIDRAAEVIFGYVLLNDWSARDLQRWEYVPLGPFLAKNFATSISPWIVPAAALEPFRIPAEPHDPAPLPYLHEPASRVFDLHLSVALQSARMERPHQIARSNARHLYWTFLQMIAHHTVNGCNLQPGDLLGSGTISGPTPESAGSLLELAWQGTRPVTLASGETRSFLADGDTVTFTGWAQGDGYRVGFGEVIGRILPALPSERVLPGGA